VTWTSRFDSRAAGFAGLAVAMVGSATLIWLATAGETLKGDEWGYAGRLSLGNSALFNPPAGKYLTLFPMLVFKLLYSTAGIESYGLYRQVGILAGLLCAGLFYLLIRRRVGDLLAVPPTVVLLFLGSSSELLATGTLRLPNLLSIAAGLGAVLVVERRDMRGDIGACALLTVALGSHPNAFAFIAAVAVLVVARPSPERWRRSWIVVAPVVLWGIWWLVAARSGQNDLNLGGIVDVPSIVGGSLSTVAASIVGLFHVRTQTLNRYIGVEAVVAWSLGILVVAAVAARAMRRPSPGAGFWAALAGTLVLWSAVAFAPGHVRPAEGSRYVYPGAVLLLWLLAETVRGLRIPRWAALAATLVFAFGAVVNARELHDAASKWAGSGDYSRAELTALDIGGPRVSPTFNPAYVPPLAPDVRLHLRTDQWHRIAASYGSPAYPVAELPHRSEPVRRAADVTLARALGLGLANPGSTPAGVAPLPKPASLTGGRAEARGHCLNLHATADQLVAQLTLPPGGVTLRAERGGSVMLALGRFADSTAFPLTALAAGHSASLEIPADQVPVPWRLGVQTPASVTVCGGT
jgi:hypothetical protein